MLAEVYAGEEDEQEATPAYADLADWVYLELAQLVERRVRGKEANVLDGRTNVRWCASWWRHPEVVSRLTAMWHAWEELRHDSGTGMSVWWRDHFDPHWAVLTSETGPMSRCTTAECDGPVPALPIVAPPPDWDPPVS